MDYNEARQFSFPAKWPFPPSNKHNQSQWHILYMKKKNLTNDEFDLAVYKLPCNAGRKNVSQH